MMYRKQGMWEEPKHHTKACGSFLPPACGPGIARHRGRRKPSRASSTSSHGRGDPVWGPTVSGCMWAVGQGEAGAGAADGMHLVRHIAQMRMNFWRRLLRLASAV